ncbi:MAG TPA: hypothetical protein DEF41_01075 [Desulfovibrio sp.]|uniref:Uncharacterized protein n=1 Tax=Nitratidesulfovibrio vulgaris (strain ATCC 29579 / DSM 644 / CCUG 34227 / NCIMB 8303 / VKM B-1760 / Hildenborough) TaxID=882 RepID=Q72DQ0_NITV2|nr:hypothetical protein DVU_0879 [Nitratidesulfovibrio vulgaris str. Hildenborough]HBW14750.1 hypothetical protein [Desulfovibrio sp.]
MHHGRREVRSSSLAPLHRSTTAPLSTSGARGLFFHPDFFIKEYET